MRSSAGSATRAWFLRFQRNVFEHTIEETLRERDQAIAAKGGAGNEAMDPAKHRVRHPDASPSTLDDNKLNLAGRSGRRRSEERYEVRRALDSPFCASSVLARRRR